MSEDLKVERVTTHSTWTEVHVEGNRVLRLPPYRYISPGDLLRVPAGGDLSYVSKHIGHPREGEPGFVTVSPVYSKQETHAAGNIGLSVTYRERKSERDWKQVKALEAFHYRGNGLNKIVGRRTVLLADVEDIGVVGYGVLSATVVANKARFALLKTNVPKQLKSKLINRIARVPRVVVHPEFRGLGIGARLAHHLAEFARDYWDIKGYAPDMVEVIASMIHYHRFFEEAGFIEAGETGGDYRIFRPVYGNGSWDERPNSGNYVFHGSSRKKPYLVRPLCESVSNALLEAGFSAVDAEISNQPPRDIGGTIVARLAGVVAQGCSNRNGRTTEVAEVFGLAAANTPVPVLGKVRCEIEAGDVALVTGASGSGKSTLLKLLAFGAKKLPAGMSVDGEISTAMEHIAVAKVRDLPERPLIDQVGDTTEAAIRLLNSVGLAEAHIYMRKPSELSDGQRHRFALAKLCASRKPIWVCDEFLTGLDPLTAAIVAKGVQRVARRQGATLIAAAANSHPFISALLPSKIVFLSWGEPARVYAAKLESSRLQSGIRLNVHNRGKLPLSSVTIELIGRDGSAVTALSMGELPPGRRSEAVLVDVCQVSSLAEIVCRTLEGAGDAVQVRRVRRNVATSIA